MKKFLQKAFSIKNDKHYHKVITFLGLKLKFLNIKKIVKKQLTKDIFSLKHRQNADNNLFMNLYLKLNYLENKNKQFNPIELFDKEVRPYNNCYLGSHNSYINLLFPNLKGTFDSNEPREPFANFFYTCGIAGRNNHTVTISEAMKTGNRVYIFEDCFLRSIFSHVYKNVEEKYVKSIGFTIDDLTHYVDATMPSRLELMLNDKDLIITEEQKARARKCIDKIIETHLSKYNNQPIYTPNIGREGVKKVLVVDQSYGDYSIIKGRGSEEIFNLMLQKAITENPDADIIVKTHPDTMSGTKGGYYTGLKQEGNIYPITEPINPISLIQYCDKVYVCTTQFGLEALMCNKEVHVFGVPFYQGWGLTIDEQICERRTNKRTLEELFYIVYIMYSHYVNPEKGCRCEIEDAIDYLLKLREEYFEKINRPKTTKKIKEIKLLGKTILLKIKEKNKMTFIFPKTLENIFYDKIINLTNGKYKHIIIYRSATGDIVFLKTVFEALKEKYGIKEKVLIVSNRKFYDEIFKLYNFDADLLYIDFWYEFSNSLRNRTHKNINFYVFHDYSFLSSLYKKKHTRPLTDEWCKHNKINRNKLKNEKATFLVDIKDIKNKTQGLNIKKFVFFAFDAGSLKPLSQEFIRKIYNSFVEQGYDVFFNSKESNLGKNKLLNYNDTLALASLAKCIVSLRSGLSDILASTDTKQFLIYNHSKTKNLTSTKVKNIWTFSDLVNTKDKNFIEYDLATDSEEFIIKNIMKNL